MGGKGIFSVLNARFIQQPQPSSHLDPALVAAWHKFSSSQAHHGGRRRRWLGWQLRGRWGPHYRHCYLTGGAEWFRSALFLQNPYVTELFMQGMVGLLTGELRKSKLPKFTPEVHCKAGHKCTLPITLQVVRKKIAQRTSLLWHCWNLHSPNKCFSILTYSV